MDEEKYLFEIEPADNKNNAARRKAGSIFASHRRYFL